MENRRASDGAMEVIAVKIDVMSEDIKEIKTNLEKHYVTQDQFRPIQKLVYGFVGLILTAVAVAIIALVIPSRATEPESHTRGGKKIEQPKTVEPVK